MSKSNAPSLMLVAGVIAVWSSLTIASCTSTKPASPSPVSYPTITITANGITQNDPSIVPGMPVMIVNADSQPHRLHLNLGVEQSGCDAFETSGELAPGQSRLTAALGTDVTSCQIHDHMNHGNPAFAAKLTVDTGE